MKIIDKSSLLALGIGAGFVSEASAHPAALAAAHAAAMNPAMHAAATRVAAGGLHGGAGGFLHPGINGAIHGLSSFAGRGIAPHIPNASNLLPGLGGGNRMSPTTGQAFARLANEGRQLENRLASDEGAARRGFDRLRNFYSDMPGGGYGGLSGYSTGTFISSGGSGNDTMYGAVIQPATGAQLQTSIAKQQAFWQGSFLAQDYELRRLQLARARFDERAYEKANTPAPETIREEQRQQRLTRARSTPPVEEIASGETLNTLLHNIERVQSRDPSAGPSLPLDPATVRHINVTSTGDSRGSNELFKPGALAQWPAALKTDLFAHDRRALVNLISDMAEANSKGSIDAARFEEARRIINAIRQTLFAERFRMPYNDYADAANYLSKLDDTVNVLGRQNAEGFLDGRFAALGDSVAKLVDHMLSQGLQFARATPGDEAYYASLYKQLVAYELAVSKKAEQSTLQQGK